MDRLIYTALTGMQRTQEAQMVTANNLANASTPGFRREMAALSPAWITPGGASQTSRVQSGGEAPHDLLRAGKVDATGNPLDIAVEGNAWLAVADASGAEALTRRGDLRFNGNGQLLTGNGQPVLGADGPIQIAAGFAEARIGPNGSIDTRADADAPWIEAGRIRLVTPDPATLARGADGLFRTPVAQADPDATLISGALERSNVEASTSLVELIEQSRGFELQTRLITTAREMDEGTAALMRIE